MELQQLRYFQLVAKNEHITKTAEMLHISQPSLSITITRLEQELGVPLFDRRGRQIRINQYGKLFLRRVDRILTELDEGKQEIKEVAGLEGGIVSLASANMTVLPQLLSQFLQTYPGTKLRLLQAPVSTMNDLLETGEVDFCISSPVVQGVRVRGVALLQENILLIVPATHMLAERNDIDLREVAGEAFVSLKAGYGLRDLMDMYCRQAGFVPNVACEVDEPLLVNTLVGAGAGIAFIPSSAWRELETTTCLPLRIKNPTCERIIGLAWLESRHLSRAAQRFRQFTIDYFHQIHP